MQYKKLNLFVILFLIGLPLAHAEECGITNLASCIPQKIYEYTLGILNAPLQPFLSLAKDLISEPVNIESFISLWAIIVYILSMFYGLFLLTAGFNMMISGYSAEKRERAKEWLKNIVLMIFFVQSSFFLYAVILEMSSALTAGVLNIIDPNFFLLTVDNLPNMGMELILTVPYLFTLLSTILLLSLRYLLVAIGVIFFPIGLFLHFIPPLKGYGKLIINTIMIIIFLPFIQILILLGASQLVKVSIFQNFKILIMTTSFLLVNLTMILLILFAIVKAAFAVINSDIGRAATKVYKMV